MTDSRFEYRTIIFVSKWVFFNMEFTVFPQFHRHDRQQVKNRCLLKANTPTNPLVQSSFQPSAFTVDEQDSALTGNARTAMRPVLWEKVSAIGFF